MTAAVNTGPAVFATPNPGKGGMPFNLPTTKADTPDAINNFSTAFLAAISNINDTLTNARNNFGQPDTPGGYAHGYVPPAWINAIITAQNTPGAKTGNTDNVVPQAANPVSPVGAIDPATGLRVETPAPATGFQTSSAGQVDPAVINGIIQQHATANPDVIKPVPPPQKGGQGFWSRVTAPLQWLVNGVGGVVNSGAAVVEQSGWKGLISNNFDEEAAKYKAMPEQTKAEYLKALRTQHKSAQADYLEQGVNPNDPIASISAGVSQKTGGMQETANDISRRIPGSVLGDGMPNPIDDAWNAQHSTTFGPVSTGKGPNPLTLPMKAGPATIAGIPMTSVSNIGAGVLGTGMSLAFDPLTYVGPKAITALTGGIKKGINALPNSAAKAVAADTAAGLNTPIGELAKTAPSPAVALDTSEAIPKPVPAIAAKLTTQARIAEDTANAAPHIATAGTDLIPPAPIAANLEHAKLIDSTVAKATQVGSYTDKSQAANLMTVTSRVRSDVKAAGDIVDPLARQVAVGDGSIALLKQVEDAHAATGIKTATGLHMSDVLSATPELRSLANETFFTLNNTGQVARVMHSEQIMAGAQKALDVSTWEPTAINGISEGIAPEAARAYAQSKMASITNKSITLDSGLAKTVFNAADRGTTLNPNLFAGTVAPKVKTIATRMGITVDKATGKATFKTVDHPLAAPGKSIAVPVPRDMQIATIQDAVKSAVPNAKALPPALLNKFANTMLDAAPALRAKTSIRIASTQTKDIADAAVIGAEASNRMKAIAENPTVSTAEAADELTNAGKKIALDAKARGMSPGAAQLAAVQSGTTAKAMGAVSSDLNAAEHMTGIVNERAVLGAFADDKVAAAAYAYAQKVARETPDIIKSLDPKLLEYLSGGDMVYGAKILVEQTNLLHRIIHPIGFKVSKWAAGVAGKPATLRQLLVQTEGAIYNHTVEFQSAIADIRKLDKATPGVATKAFDMMRMKVSPTAATEATVTEAYQALAPLYDYLFNLGKGSKSESLFGLAWRNGGTVKQVNRYLKDAGIDFQFDLKAAKGDYAVMADQMLTAKIKDPLDFMTRANKAYNTLATNQVVGATFTRNFGKSVLEMTPNEAKTWVKITDPAKIEKLSAAELARGEKIKQTFALDPEKLHFYDHINKNLYYPPEAVAKMGNLERIARQTSNLVHIDGGFGTFVNQVYDPFIVLFKASVTTMRPGHHVKNFISDVLINSLSDGIYSAKAYFDAKDIIKVSRGLASEPTFAQIMSKVDMGAKDITANLSKSRFGDLSGSGLDTAKGAPKTIGDHFATAVFKAGGDAPKSYSYGETYRSAKDNGILSNFHATLDLQDVETSISKNPITTLTHKLIASRASEAAGKLSNMSEYDTRLAQYITLIKNPEFTKQFKNALDMEAAAAAKVRRFHPEVSGLNNFEQKYMRRIMPFYSWFRQTAPAVLEAGIVNPGRIQMYNKVMYGGSIATGGNPNTINDPFDVNTVYPSFIRDMESTAPLKIGGMDIGYDLGGPTESLAELMNGNPVSNALSMSSPLVYAPLELLAGKQLRMDSGGPIGNTNDYFDKLTPFVNDFAEMTGYSPTGTVMNILGHTPSAPSQEGKHPVFARSQNVLTGNKNTFINLSTLNFLSGLGIANYGQKNMYEAGLQELQTGLYR